MNLIPLILLVEDNPITRKMVRVTLEIENFAVLEAENGKQCIELLKDKTPDLMLLDLRLPDITGNILVKQIKEDLKFKDIPILAFSNILSPEDKGTELLSGFNGYIIKPIEPSLLIKVIREYLFRRDETKSNIGLNRKILLVDDDIIQLKSLKIYFQNFGFIVDTAEDGETALKTILHSPPDVIISDVLMPKIDGFKLCLTLRQSSKFALIPIILIATYFIEKSDKNFAKALGAYDLIFGIHEQDKLLEVVLASLEDKMLPTLPPPSILLENEYQQKIIRQLEKQAKMNIVLSQQCAQQATELAVLEIISDSIKKSLDIEPDLPSILARCFDVAGISAGALYLKKLNEKIDLSVQIGFDQASLTNLQEYFDINQLFEKCFQSEAPIIIPFADISYNLFITIPTHRKTEHIILASVATQFEKYGILMFVSHLKNSKQIDWIDSCKMIGIQLGQAIALSRSISLLKNSEAHSRILMESANDGIFVLNAKGIVLEVNEKSCEISGYIKEKMIGKPFTDFVHPSDAQKAMVEFQRVYLEDKAIVKNIKILRPDGTIKEIDFATSTVNLNNSKVLFAIARDMTENNLLEAKLRQSQKLEAVGQLAGGIAHDFNNILTVIGLSAEVALKRLKGDETTSVIIKRILTSQQRAAVLTKQLLTFSRKELLEFKSLNINQILLEIQDMLERLIGENISLILTCEKNLNSIFADKGNIEQIIINLAVNAKDAMPEGGKIFIETKNVYLKRSDIPLKEATVAEGPFISLIFTDTGCGINPTVLNKIFDPFFTTKSIGKGTGLGLATVYGIVHNLQGFISVSSKLGEGTTFSIYFPQKIGDEEKSIAENTVLIHKNKGEVILVIEDEQLLKESLVLTLQEKGYLVLEATNAIDGLSIIKNNLNKIDLVITDVIMPEMNGYELVKFGQKFQKDMKVLYISGYTEDILTQNHLNLKQYYFLKKPFLINAILEKIQEILN